MALEAPQTIRVDVSGEISNFFFIRPQDGFKSEELLPYTSPRKYYISMTNCRNASG